jgi:hypothetical protein
MKTRTSIIGLFFILFFSTNTVYAQEMGLFSSYLVGTYDMRGGHTLLQIINPTAKGFDVYIAFFDADEKPLMCKKDKLSHNDLLEIDVRALKLDVKFGVVKIVSLRDKKPVPGIVGFQRHFFVKVGVTESNLAAVPAKILEEEIKVIMDVCK